MGTNSYIANLVEKLHAIAASNSDLRVAERETCTAAAEALQCSHDGPSDKADGPTERLLATVDQVALLLEQCEAGLQVEHDCPAMYALACIYAEFFGDEDSGKHDATVDKEKVYRQWGKDE